MRSLIIVLLASILFVSCTSNYGRLNNGYEYKVIHNNAGDKAVYGNVIQFHLRQFYSDNLKDTVLGDTRDNYVSRIEKLDSATLPVQYVNALEGASKGDSIVIRISVDSAYNYPYAQIPKYMRKGGYIYTTIKLLNVLKNEDLADSVRRADIALNGRKLYDKQMADIEKELQKDSAQLIFDINKIKEWLEKKHIPYIKGKLGAFVHINKEGEGRTIAYNDVIAVNYSEHVLDSTRILDSNTDPVFNHVEPYELNMRQVGMVVPGWIDALQHLKKGSKATIYIPSSLAFGKKGKPGKIAPNTNIVFDIEVLNVISEDEAIQITTANRHRREALEKHDTQVPSLLDSK